LVGAGGGGGGVGKGVGVGMGWAGRALLNAFGGGGSPESSPNSPAEFFDPEGDPKELQPAAKAELDGPAKAAFKVAVNVFGDFLQQLVASRSVGALDGGGEANGEKAKAIATVKTDLDELLGALGMPGGLEKLAGATPEMIMAFIGDLIVKTPGLFAERLLEFLKSNAGAIKLVLGPVALGGLVFSANMLKGAAWALAQLRDTTTTVIGSTIGSLRRETPNDEQPRMEPRMEITAGGEGGLIDVALPPLEVLTDTGRNKKDRESALLGNDVKSAQLFEPSRGAVMMHSFDGLELANFQARRSLALPFKYTAVVRDPGVAMYQRLAAGAGGVSVGDVTLWAPPEKA